LPVYQFHSHREKELSYEVCYRFTDAINDLSRQLCSGPKLSRRFRDDWHGTAYPPPNQQDTPNLETPITPDLDDNDQETLKSCAQKSSGLMTGIQTVDTVDVGSSIFNKESFSDSYTGTERRILIVNISVPIANKISLRLSNPATTYCLNITSQIINKLDIGISSGSKLIEARKVSLSNKITTYPL
jgi:hypothetical protein